MIIRYVTEPGYGVFWWPPLGPSRAVGQYAGAIDVPSAYCWPSHLTVLHEMAHALVYNTRGVSQHELDNKYDELEAEASAIALAWVTPKYRKQARAMTLRWLITSVGDPAIATKLLTAATRQIKAQWVA